MWRKECALEHGESVELEPCVRECLITLTDRVEAMIDAYRRVVRLRYVDCQSTAVAHSGVDAVP